MSDPNKPDLKAKVRAHKTPWQEFNAALDELKRRDPNMWWTIWTEVQIDAEYPVFTARIRERLDTAE